MESGSGTEGETTGFLTSVLLFPGAGVLGSGRATGVDTTSPPLPPFFPPVLVGTGGSEDETLPPLPPFFPPVLVETGRSEDKMVSFPSFPPLPVGEGTAGEVEETAGNETVELKTSEEETPLWGGTTEEETALASFPPSVTVIWGRHVRTFLTVVLVWRMNSHVDRVVEATALGDRAESLLMITGRIDGGNTVDTSWESLGNVGGQDTVFRNTIETLEEIEDLGVQGLRRVERC